MNEPRCPRCNFEHYPSFDCRVARKGEVGQKVTKSMLPNSMKRLSLILLLILPLTGCPNASTTTPPAAVAPGYSSSADQTLGQSLAAVVAFTNQEKANFAALPVDKQAIERPYLNSLILAVNAADSAYLAFHAGTQSIAQAQAALTKAQSAQTALVNQKEGK